MGHVMVMVPDGHAVQVHPPGSVNPPGAGMVADPAQSGALQAMNAALPVPGETKSSPPDRQQPKRKKPVKKEAGKKDAKAGK